MTRHWQLPVFIACLLLTQTPSRADTIPEIVKRAKPAVVKIVALDEKGSPTSLGTGFFISSDGIVATNCHVIAGASSLAAFDIYGGMFKVEVVITCSSEHDIALVKFPFSNPAIQDQYWSRVTKLS
jgi:S1-C subfamily serine protease